jgi:hypothetical protein
MFAYDMLGTASRNLGWQTHYLNLVYTPRKAMSAIIAAEAMRRLPLFRSYGPYPGNTRFGDFHVAYEENLGELVARDAFLNAGPTRSAPPEPKALRRVAGYGSSPVVSYGGEGVYFLDRIRPGAWRLEVYPDAVPVRDPFEPPNPDKIVTRLIGRAWPMTVSLPDLGTTFSVQPVTAGNPRIERAASGRFTVTPGVFVLSATGRVDPVSLPAFVGQVGFTEYHAPPSDSLPPSVQSLAPPQVLAGRDAQLVARVVDRAPPDSVTLFLRPEAGFFWRPFTMRPAGGYDYAAAVPAAALREGPWRYVITLWRRDSATTFPAGLPLRPNAWDYYATAAWDLEVVSPATPLSLFDPGRDAARLAFSRIGDAGRLGIFRLGMSEATGRPAFHLELPTHPNGQPLDDYTASLTIKDRIEARQETIAAAGAVTVRLRSLRPGQVLHLTLVEDDGTSWSATVPGDSTWGDRTVPLASFAVGRSVLLPEGFPGEWNYWVGPAAGRGSAGDHVRLDHVERLQLSLRAGDGVPVVPGGYGVEVESVMLSFGAPR